MIQLSENMRIVEVEDCSSWDLLVRVIVLLFVSVSLLSLYQCDGRIKFS